MKIFIIIAFLFLPSYAEAARNHEGRGIAVAGMAILIFGIRWLIIKVKNGNKKKGDKS